jgi:hypothetical protein
MAAPAWSLGADGYDVDVFAASISLRRGKGQSPPALGETLTGDRPFGAIPGET